MLISLLMFPLRTAKTAETSNFKNTVGSLKRLIGRSLQETDVSAIALTLGLQSCKVKQGRSDTYNC